MIKKYDMDCVQGVRSGMFLYADRGTIEKIDLRKSAKLWWDKHHKTTIMDAFLRKRTKNIYVGDKCFNFSEPYIRLYVEKYEVVFSKNFPDEVDTSDASEFRMWWDEINRGLNQQGYWLFDEE